MLDDLTYNKCTKQIDSVQNDTINAKHIQIQFARYTSTCAVKCLCFTDGAKSANRCSIQV